MWAGMMSHAPQHFRLKAIAVIATFSDQSLAISNHKGAECAAICPCIPVNFAFARPDRLPLDSLCIGSVAPGLEW
jgi:hypothetical protein